MVTTIVLSKDRPAQLELLLRSLDENGGGQFEPEIIWRGHKVPMYVGAPEESAWFPVLVGRSTWFEINFERDVRNRLDAAGELVCFMCDDGILYRPPGPIALDDDVLCLSLRLGWNTTVCYPTGRRQPLPRWERLRRFGTGDEMFMWRWADEPTEPGVSDFGYPGSVDAHVFRTADVQRMLAGRSFPNPTALECALVDGCRELAAERPLMACFPHSVYVGNPVNRVSEQSGVRYGTRFPAPADECARRFQAGERINLGALDFSAVDGAHTEIELIWASATEISI